MSPPSQPSNVLDPLPALGDFLETPGSQVVWARMVGDLETPVSAFMKLARSVVLDEDRRSTIREHPNAFLLESVEGGAVRGRYSIIGLAPDRIFQANGDTANLTELDAEGMPVGEPEDLGPTLRGLRTFLSASRITLPDALPPMSAGVFGYLGYDTVRLVERLPSVPEDALGIPDGIMVRPTVMVIFDGVRDEITIVAPIYAETPATRLTSDDYAAAVARLEHVADRLNAPIAPALLTDDANAGPADIEPASNTSQEDYLAMVARAKEYISAGDIFQVVLSQRFSTPFPLPAFSLYRALRRTNPSPFLFYLNFAGHAIVGSSPEILVRVRGGEVTIRPIAGTRPRGKTQTEDARLAAELLADEKELAEHLMLVDLGRNDVGRVAKIGTVSLTSSFFLEYYSHVMHIVSNVVGELDDSQFDAIDALMAGFPAGTVSGAPKVRAMEIIDELERHKRGPYAGCVGYFSADGEMDTCIVLRTAVVKDGVMHIQAGAGIVADSVPENEQAECENKARALFKAAEEAVARLRPGANR